MYMYLRQVIITNLSHSLSIPAFLLCPTTLCPSNPAPPHLAPQRWTTALVYLLITNMSESWSAVRPSDEVPLGRPNWGPEIEWPSDPQDRVNELKRLLADKSTDPRQLVNIRAVLAALEAGETPARYYQFGKPFSRLEDVELGKPLWPEGPFHQFINSTRYVQPTHKMF
ncbi:hypothetical protein TWF696_003237 [Orbilia brochopaga]|uniref:Uncharacterized protein n=1 Tax=Orbilia brochopaga TaxID=3140254 RepID=A0AAV9U1N3_9PEZI